MAALTGKSAIVTGGASGIGRAIALRYAREGATVCIADQNVAGGEQTVVTIRDAGGQAAFQLCDVADPEQARATVERAAAESGRLDIVVNVAGVGGGGAPAEDIAVEDFNRVLAVNLAGPFYFAKYAIPHLRKQGGGSIINISSVYGIS